MTLSRELLIAYLDDELGVEDRRRVEDWVEKDSAAAEDLAELEEQQRVLKAAFEGELAEPLPAQTLSLFVDAPGEGAAGPMGAWWQASIAAGLTAAIVGGLVAYGMSGLRTDQILARYEAERAADRAQLASVMQEALESNPSGQAAQWNGDAGTAGGQVIPIRTYQNTAGNWCREYRAEAKIGLETIALEGVACRSNAGTWITKAERQRVSSSST